MRAIINLLPSEEVAITRHAPLPSEVCCVQEAPLLVDVEKYPDCTAVIILDQSAVDAAKSDPGNVWDVQVTPEFVDV